MKRAMLLPLVIWLAAGLALAGGIPPLAGAATISSTDLSFKPQNPDEGGDLWIKISLAASINFYSIYVKVEPDGTGIGNDLSIMDFSDEETEIEGWSYTEKFADSYAEYRAASATQITGSSGDVLLFAQISVPDDLAEWDINTKPTVKIAVQLDDTSYEARSRIGLDTTFGDISGNGEVVGYDGAIVLQWNVGVKNSQTDWLDTRWGKQVADVSGNGTADQYDVALILQYEAGTITAFPSASDAHPAPAALPAKPVLVAFNAERVGDLDWVVSLTAQNAADTVSGFFQFWTYSQLAQAGKVEPIGLQNPIIASNNAYDDVFKISWAQAQKVGSDGRLMQIAFQTSLPMDRLPVVLQTAKFDENREVLIIEAPQQHWSVDEWLKQLPHLRFGDLPAATRLLQNYPNPFNPETWIPFKLARASDVMIRIYDLRGKMILKLPLGFLWPAQYTTRGNAAYWNGRNKKGEKVASGTYIYVLQAGDFTSARKMVILK